MNQFKYTMKSYLVVLLSSLSLYGCFQEELEHWINKETYAFQGTYENQHNTDLIAFHQAKASIQSEGKSMVVPFQVDGNFIYIQVRQSSKEKREDIVMRIHGNGEVLTCSACAKYHLSNIWVRTVPDIPTE
ncbi:hypothetical protein VR7878_02477 [Vibrio ruber DSM 16370]|uniref:Lipoprotein n=1 Tax=Vibrio ruber (strain DSM 16370 / JCM 11486 / BCRC 17186 / CECT 7878 / LMG 23124 / VR1) TaxID=1123498 RepID=A0A1R4LMF4_VIBR1|nr:hypothetical protein [Vibrio ruber]SJN57776.1 hypothetical protein VR7878_02477 [Vibrio ruber DSM 16370]